MAGRLNGTAMPEKRGWLVDQFTGSRQYVALRSGQLRFRETPKTPDVAFLSLVEGCTVSLLNNTLVQIKATTPHSQEHRLLAPSETEAEAWHDAILESIRTQKAKIEKYLKLLESGCTMHKYNYSNSKRTRRYFWVDDEGRDLCWGRSKNEDTQKVNLRECIGIIYGPMTTTFQRCPNREDSAWCCFSLLFTGRTLDLAVVGELQALAWFMGLQHLVAVHGIGSMPSLSEAQFILRKAQLKLIAAAHENGLVLGRFLLERLKSTEKSGSTGGGIAAQNKGKGLGRGALVSGGPLAKPMTLLGPLAVKPSGSKKDKKQREAAPEDSEAAAKLTRLKAHVFKLQSKLREHTAMADAAEALLKKAASIPADVPDRAAQIDSMLREAMLQSLQTRSAAAEEQATKLQESNEKLAPEAKAADKAERSLKKLQGKFEELEGQKAALEQDLSKARAKSAAASGQRQSFSSAEVEGKSKGNELQRQIQELELKLQESAAKQSAAQAAAENQRQDEAIARAEQEKVELSQQLEATRRSIEKAQESEAASKQRLAKAAELNRKLDGALAPLRQAATRLRDEQQRARSEVESVRQNFTAQVEKLLGATSRIGEEMKAIEAKFKAAIEDRKKLHNQVLDLKGNIRVFVRVRPINAKETPHEPPGEPTVSFKEDTSIGVFDGQKATRKWFEFDQVFSPDTTQAAVFEEACPLATSTLDGYNVCIFAYGQTGSGKTHTMTGTPTDPGLNTRVLRELFRIRDERKGEYDINISLSITEIYNEVIRDLLCPSPKKLDVKQNPDGTCGVPGLTDVKVGSVEDVLKCIGDAAANRSTSTTDMNEQSSRSHSIVTVRTESTLRGGDTYLGKIHLIDLAGSENTNKSGVSGQGMKEAQNINRSLSALGDVIQSLVAKNPHTPYRNSKLTMMLKDSLGGDSKTLMIVCSSPAQFNVTETLSSLNFASRARNVELGKATRKAVTGG